MHVYRYPHYGYARPGTNVYERGGHAYGGWSAVGGWGAAATTPTAVAMIPEPAPDRSKLGPATIDQVAYANAMQDQARAAKAASITAAATNNPFAFAAQEAASKVMATKAADAARGNAPARGIPNELPPQASEAARQARAAALARGAKPGGMGRGIPWKGKTPREKAATVAVGAGGVGAAWWLLAL